MMKSMNKFGAFAAMAAAVVFAYSAGAIDWPEPGGTYTVPADTTVEVGADDFDDVNALSKVILANSNSVMRFTTTTFPSNPEFEGNGTVLMAAEVDPGSLITLRRGMDDAASGNLVKFDFAGGIKSNEMSECVINLYPTVFSNATIRYHGKLPYTFRPSNHWWHGRYDFAEDIETSRELHLGYIANSFGVIRQRGGSVTLINGDCLFGGSSATGAYFLEGGSLQIRNNENRWFVYGRYVHFRLTGGSFSTYCLQRPGSVNSEYTLPADIIYGGTSTVDAGFERSTPRYKGPFNLTVMDDAQVNAYWLEADPGSCGEYRRIISVNGGELTMDTRAGATNVFYSFNGGTLRNTSSGGTMFGNQKKGWVRIYEKGGCIYNDNTSNADSRYLYPPCITEPVGNVVWEIPIPDGHELKTRTWQAPPAVVIADSTGNGSNAVAIVDYDFDTGRVTNLTVVCRGENYSDEPGAVTANFAYKNGDELLSEPLVCRVGPCEGGDVTFAGGRAFRVQADTTSGYGITNKYHGATIIDMDRHQVSDHGRAHESSKEYHRCVYLYTGTNPRPRFHFTTNLVIKSGAIWRANSGDNFRTAFPDCWRLEFYGGHMANCSATFNDVVIGGETWLVNFATNQSTTVTVSGSGTVWVDYGAKVTNDVIVTPKLRYGTVTFNSGAKIAVKNWEALPRGKRTLVLDLSETTFTTKGKATFVESDEGLLSWGTGSDAEEKRLYARRNSAGMMLIFK